MLNHWVHWTQSLHPIELLSIAGVLLLDGTRYAFSAVTMALIDISGGLWRRLTGRSPGRRANDYLPSVCVLIAGHNEADTIEATLASLWSSYPRLDIIVIDDGSTDGMAEKARGFAQNHPGIQVLSRSRRGGKSSALNWGLANACADVIITLDADSRLGPNAVREIVQPLRDPSVGAVSGNVTVWNVGHRLVTRLQAYEYRQSIFLARQMQARTGTLGIVSGAFGAFRREVLEQVMGWDAGSGEDGDLTLRIRKSGFAISFAPHAECLTNAPESWSGLFRQRLRWDRAVITFECRKHVDLGKFWQRHFQLSNFLLVLERWLFNVVFVLCYWVGMVWLIGFQTQPVGNTLLLLYLCQLCLETATACVLLYYSDRRLRDLELALTIPLLPLYQAFIKLVDLVAVLDELILRKSYQDNYVPAHVRQATWKW